MGFSNPVNLAIELPDGAIASQTWVMDRARTVLDYRAVGDGIADDTNALQAAAGPGGVVLLPPGEYRITAPIEVTGHGVEIRGSGPGQVAIVCDFPGVPNSNSAAIQVRGSVPEYVSPAARLTADAAGAVLQVDTAAAFTAGDVVLIGDDFADVWSDAGWSGRRRGELARVVAVSSTTVTLAGPVRDPYVVSLGAAIWKPSMIEGFTLSGVTIRHAQPGTSWVHGVHIEAARNVAIRDVVLEHLDGSGVYLAAVYGASLSGVVTRDLTDDGSTDRYGYGITVGAAEGVEIRGGRHERVRHAVTTTGRPGHVGYARGVLISDVVAARCSSTGIDTHPWASDVTITGCRAEYNGGAGIMVRAARVTVSDNVTRGNANPGVSVSLRQATDVLVVDNAIMDEAGAGIGFGGSAADGYPARVEIRDNSITRSVSWGVYVGVPVDNLRLVGNTLVDCHTGAGSAGARQAIHIDSGVPLAGALIVGNLASGVNNVVQVAAAQTQVIATGNRLVNGVGTSPAAVKGAPGSGVLVDNTVPARPVLTYSRAGESAAAAQLRAAMVALDLATDSTTA